MRIIIPTWNESENIIELLNRITKTVATTSYSFETVIVDDNSPDKTADLVIEYANNHRFIKVITRQSKLGYGSAFRNGLKYAVQKQDTIYVITMDADLSHQPEEIPKLLNAAENADVVQGSRYIQGGVVRGWGLYRWIVSLTANFLVRVLFQTGLREHTTSFRLFSSKAASVVVNETRSKGWAWLIEAILVVKKKGFKITEIPIFFTDREKGKSKMGLRDMVNWFVFLINYRFRTFKD